MAWDMPGYGRSEPLPAFTFSALAKSLEQLLDSAGVERAVLLGHSLGGMIALEATARLSARLDGLLLACTTPAFGAPAGAAQQAFLDRRLGMLDRGGSMAELAAGLIPSMLGDEPDARLAASHQSIMAGIAPDSYRRAMHALASFDCRARLREITCPTLCVAGECDQVSVPLVMRRMAEQIPGAGFVVLKGAGHLAPFEQPSAFATELGRLLDDPAD